MKERRKETFARHAMFQTDITPPILKAGAAGEAGDPHFSGYHTDLHGDEIHIDHVDLHPDIGHTDIHGDEPHLDHVDLVP